MSIRRQPRRRGRTQIPRYDMPMVRRTIVKSSVTADNPFANNQTSYTFENAIASSCTIQPLKPSEFSILSEGLRQEAVFSIITNTPLFQSINNTDRLSDSIYIPDSWFSYNGFPAATGQGGWYTVVTPPKHFATGIVNHCQAMIVKDSDMVDTAGLSKYPSTSALAPLVDTREKLFGTAWHTTWIS